MAISRMELALRIIAGVDDPFPCWGEFFDSARPAARPEAEGTVTYRLRIGNLVRAEACRIVAAKLDEASSVLGL